MFTLTVNADVKLALLEERHACQHVDIGVQGKRQYRRGTTNVWSILSVDTARDLVFLPTGNTSTD